MEKENILDKVFSGRGLGIYFIGVVISFVLNRILNVLWTQNVILVLTILYIALVLVSIYNSKVKPLLELNKMELLLYQIIIPFSLTVLLAAIQWEREFRNATNELNTVIQWLQNSEEQSVLALSFSIFVLICYFTAYERQESLKMTKTECKFKETPIDQEKDQKIDEISSKLEAVKEILEKKSQVAYTATCIPIKYNADHNSFMFTLIKNLSHQESQWMFPGSHIDISDNHLNEEFDLNEVEIVPGRIISDKVKREAGLVDLKFIDPYYEANGLEQRNYPNTCYPTKTPVFNYLFRVSKSAKCYKEQNHRCHYDFTFVGEYNTINEEEAEYDVIEIELNRSKKLESMERADAVAYITGKLTDQINKKMSTKSNYNKKSSMKFTIPFDKLCLDSIPEMIYNAILFYEDYKKNELIDSEKNSN